jgi:hypothetical protein
MAGFPVRVGRAALGTNAQGWIYDYIGYHCASPAAAEGGIASGVGASCDVRRILSGTSPIKEAFLTQTFSS